MKTTGTKLSMVQLKHLKKNWLSICLLMSTLLLITKTLLTPYGYQYTAIELSKLSIFQKKLLGTVTTDDIQQQWLLSPWERKRKTTYSHNCTKIFNGDLFEIKRLKSLLKEKPYKQADPEEIYQWAKDCVQYRKYYQPQIKYVTREEKAFPIAFSIRMHKSVEQVEHFLRHIYAPQNLYCIHVDKKCHPSIHKAMRQIASCFGNVFMVSKVEDHFFYGTPSHLVADIQCMKDSIKHSSSWKYFVNLVGEEFPIKTNYEVVGIAKILNGSNGISTYIPTKRLLKERILAVWDIRGSEMLATNKSRTPFKGIKTFYKGTEYGYFSRAFIEWCITDELPIALLQYFKQGTKGTEEIYWSTLNRLPEAPGNYPYSLFEFTKAVIWYKNSLVKDGYKDQAPCRGHFVHNICIYTMTELLWLLKQPQPFGNKFRIDEDPLAIDCLAQHIKTRRMLNIHEDLSYIYFTAVAYDKVL